MADAVSDEIKEIEDYIKGFGPDGLVKSLFFNDYAINALLLDSKNKDSKKLKKQLIEIVNGKHSLSAIHQNKVNQCIDSFISHPFQGPTRFIAKWAANMEYIIKAIEHLSVLIDTDNEIYETLLDAAKGKKSNIVNIRDAAIIGFVRYGEKRNSQLKDIALNPQNSERDRRTAYSILALRGLPKDREIYDMICDLADDLYIGDSVFEVVDYVINYIGNDTRLQNDFGSVDTSKLTSQLCKRMETKPSFHVTSLCRYLESIDSLPKEQKQKVYNTLIKIRFEFNCKPYAETIDGTIQRVQRFI